MTTLRLFLLAGFIASTSLVLAGARFEIERVYRFPTRILAMHDGKELPVAGVAGQRALVAIEGEEKKLKLTTAYRLTRGSEYAQGGIEFKFIERMDVEPYAGSEVESPIGSLIDYARLELFETDLEATEDLSNCFALLVLYEPAALALGRDATRRILFKEIGDLKKGQTKRLKINLAGTNFALNGFQAFPIVYSEGREVRSQISDFVGSYCRRADLSNHYKLVANYVGKQSEASRELVCYRLYPAVPTRGPDASSYPNTVSAEVEVSQYGVVQMIDFADELPPHVRADAIECLRDWFFLPRIEDGKAVAAKGRIEIAFEK